MMLHYMPASICHAPSLGARARRRLQTWGVAAGQRRAGSARRARSPRPITVSATLNTSRYRTQGQVRRTG